MPIERYRAIELARAIPTLTLFALVAWTTPAQAAGDGFSDVSFTASGSAGAWLLDFTVLPINSSNMAHLSFIETFQVGPEAGSDLAHPVGYTATTSGGATAWHGTKAVSPTFQTSYPAGISGFETLSTSSSVPQDVSWSVLLASGSFGQDFYVDGGYQATVLDAGVAHITGQIPGVPEPGTLPLLLAGLAAVGVGAKARRWRAAPARAH